VFQMHVLAYVDKIKCRAPDKKIKMFVSMPEFLVAGIKQMPIWKETTSFIAATASHKYSFGLLFTQNE
jgi:hypothetical protein